MSNATTRTCPRCKGSGKHGECNWYGRTCFKCNGTGKALTAEGEWLAAQAEATRMMEDAKERGMALKALQDAETKAYKVRAMERELVALRAQFASARAALRVLVAADAPKTFKALKAIREAAQAASASI